MQMMLVMYAAEYQVTHLYFAEPSMGLASI